MSTVEEVALWRAVTAELYGEDRIEDLEEEEEQDEEEEPEARPRLRPIPALMGPAEPDVGTRPSPRPVGFAGEAPGEQARPAIRDEGGRGEEKGRASPAPSSGYTGVSMSEMQRKLFALHDPRYESLAAYRARAERISHALEVLGQEVGPADLRSVIMKAELIQEGYEALGDFDPRNMVGHLKEQFIMLANDDTKEPEEKGLTTVAIAELIQDLGGRVRTAPEKVFSTPSDELQDDRNRGSKRSREPTDGDEGVVALRSKMVAMQMELESLKKDKDKDRAASEASSPEKELANALEHQTAALMKALEGRNQSQVMSVKTDLQWPTLGDERSDSKDVSEFYEHFEDNCGLANSCKGMNYREMLLALRSRCRGSRLKTFTNLYKSAYRA